MQCRLTADITSLETSYESVMKSMKDGNDSCHGEAVLVGRNGLIPDIF